MKQLILLAFVALMFTAPRAGFAQTTTNEVLPAAPDAVAASYEARSASWWRGLQKQLQASVRVRYENVDPVVLQNILYFALNHPDKMDLTRTVPSLLEVYSLHPDPALRILALRSLHLLADEEVMDRIAKVSRHEPSPLVKRIALAVVVDHRAQHGR